MKAIRVLPDRLSRRIAAGEVIERPASVVKELVENSLDAGATRISVEVRDGGRSMIRVVDTGHGIEPDEVELAFERFATSKVDESSDLVGIATLGFRGEALPSIASVSSVDISSQTVGAAVGVRRVFEFGETKVREQVGLPAGTSITVRDLFRNVPARLKFLSSAGAELARVHQLIASYALARPEISFRLASDESERLSTSGRGNLMEAVGNVYGARIAEAMLELPDPGPAAPSSTNAGFVVAGLVGAPTVSRGNRNYTILSVNGRWIQNRRLSFAIEQAYHGFLADRRFPIAVIQIRVPSGDVDVNVHPAKTEVRFLREQIVFAELQRSVRAALLDLSPVPGVTGVRPARGWSERSERPAVAAPNPLWPDPFAATPLGQMGSSLPGKALGAAGPDAEGRATAPSVDAPDEVAPTPQRALPVMRVIGQTQDTYIIAEGPDGVYLIDQHAAHERVLFEEIGERVARHASESQQLLAPETVELDPHQEDVLARHGELLKGVGYTIEPFGARAVLVRAVPKVLGREAPSQGLLGLLDSLAEGASPSDWREHLITSLACHASVTAGRRMSADESRELVRRLEETQQPHTCPHGRPTMIHLSAASLAREFKRR